MTWQAICARPWPRDQSRAPAGQFALDSHRSFAGALDEGAAGDALDGFVVHSQFVRVDAPLGEGEGGGLVPPGVGNSV